MTEIYRDYVLRIAPVSVEEGMEMIEQVKGFAAIRGATCRAATCRRWRAPFRRSHRSRASTPSRRPK